MNESKHIDQFKRTLKQLENAAKSMPDGPDFYKSLNDKLNKKNAAQYRCRRRRPLLMIIFIFICLVTLCLIVWGIISPL